VDYVSFEEIVFALKEQGANKMNMPLLGFDYFVLSIPNKVRSRPEKK
jgi:hypothetical protein